MPFLAAALVLFIGAAAYAKKYQSASPEIDFTVSMPRPWTHLLEVEMHLRNSKVSTLVELKMPVWTPGSYLVREYSRHVQDFSAKNPAGNQLKWEKTKKNTWQIATGGAREIFVNYLVYANELTVRTNELNDEHAFFTPAALLMYPNGQLAAPSTVRVVPYRNWKVATGLPAIAGETNTFRAENFDILYDSPFEVSDFTDITFSARGKPHRYVMSGRGNYDLNRIVEDTAKIVDQSGAIFGGVPYNDYTFIVNLRGGGGLEHINSTALQWRPFGFKPESRYKEFLGLVAHEYVHLWNVKRIRPDALGPFDYENENYTKLLWVAEGGTSYYGDLLLQRAGIVTDGEFLSARAGEIRSLQSTPGRFETSLEDASFDSWIKFYRPDENSVNNQISYYDKGETVCFLLDIKIRTESNGVKSLDDVMRYLYDEFYKKGRNYTPADFQNAAELMAGKSLDLFFSKYVRGKAEIDYDGILNPMGLRLFTGEDGESHPFMGGTFNDDDGKLTVRSVASDTPAYRAGLNAGDEIVAVDGYRANSYFLNREGYRENSKFFKEYLKEKQPGDKIRLTVFRFDTLRDIVVELAGRADPIYRIVPVENPTDDQKRLYRQYMSAELR